MPEHPPTAVSLAGRAKASYVHLDLIRGLAALAVLASHLRNLFFLDYGPFALGPVGKLIYFATGFGHQAVIVFFVLSGFFISRSVQNAWDDARWSWRWYLCQRLSRLWAVLLPALILTVVWDRLGLWLLPQAPIYSGTAESNVVAGDLPARSTPTVFLGNFLFVQTLLVPPLGSNGPLWSLANEFWYYLLFPALGIVVRGLGSVFYRAIAAIVAISIFGFIGWPMLPGFIVWMLGYACYCAVQSERCRDILGRWYVGAVGAGWFVVMLVLVRSGRLGALGADLAVGLSFALFMGFAAVRDVSPSRIYAGMARFLARISYSMYLFHLPALVFLSAVLIQGQRWAPTVPNALLGLAIALGVVGYVAFMYWCFEARTDFIRKKWFERWLLPRAPAEPRGVRRSQAGQRGPEPRWAQSASKGR